MTPYRYFKDKDEIFSAIRTRAFSRFADKREAALAEDGEFEIVLAETMRILSSAYRTR
jgi:AcrR family transcriptional regulator